MTENNFKRFQQSIFKRGTEWISGIKGLWALQKRSHIGRAVIKPIEALEL